MRPCESGAPEHEFRAARSITLRIRPEHHWAETRVRGHIYLGMLAYHVRFGAQLGACALGPDTATANLMGSGTPGLQPGVEVTPSPGSG